MFSRSYHFAFLVRAFVFVTIFFLCALHIASHHFDKTDSPNLPVEAPPACVPPATTEAPKTTSLPTVDPAELRRKQEWTHTQNKRKQVIADHCRDSDLTLADLLDPAERTDFDILDLTIVDDKHQLLYCYVPRVAATNWRRVFLVLTGQVAPDMIDIIKRDPRDMTQFKTLKSYSVTERLKIVENFKKFLFVRHPYNRLDSVYYDRLLYDPTINDNFQKLIGSVIIKRYRPKELTSPESLILGHDVKFPELVQYLTDEQNPVRMTNVHFTPIADLCHPCQMNYDYIGKYETLVEDAEMILKEVNVSLPFVFPPSSNKESKRSKHWNKDMQLLTDEQQSALFKEYREDFDLFDYDPESWKQL